MVAYFFGATLYVLVKVQTTWTFHILLRLFILEYFNYFCE